MEGWFSGKSDPASVDATLPPELTPVPAASTSKPISALNDKTLTTLVIDVGQGSCSLLMSPNGKTMLIDSGDADHYTAVVSVLEEQGVKKLDTVFATAAEDKYIGAMMNIVNDYEIGTFYVCPSVVSCGSYSELLGLLEEKKIKVQQVWADTPNAIKWDKSCDIEVLAPIKGSGQSPEYPDCTVLRVSHKGCSILFAGALSGNGEDLLVTGSAANQIKSNVLCVAENGADGSTGSRFLGSVSPKYAIISAGAGSGCPADAVLARLNSRGINIFRTDKSGTVSIVIDENGIKFK